MAVRKSSKSSNTRISTAQSHLPNIIEIELESIGNHSSAIQNAYSTDRKLREILKASGASDIFMAEKPALIDERTGQRHKSFFIAEQSAKAAIQAFADFMDKQEQKSGNSNADDAFTYDIKEKKASLVNAYTDLYSARSVARAKRDIKERGGLFEESFTKNNRNRYKATIPIREEDLEEGMTKRGIAVSYLKKAHDISKLDAEDKQKKEEAALASRIATEADRSRKNADKEEEREQRKLLKDKEKKDNEEKKKQEKEEKEKQEMFRNATTALKKVAITIAALLAISRRILSAMNERVHDQRDSSLKGLELNMSAEKVEKLKSFARAQGMDENVFTDATKEVQSAFANPEKLNQKALHSLAMFVPGLEKFVLSGMGKEKPYELLKIIVEYANKLVEQGKNKYGTYVGQNEARRLMIEELYSFFPTLGTMFTHFSEANLTSGGEIDTLDQWLSTFQARLGNLNEVDLQALKTLSLETNRLAESFKGLVDTELKKLALGLAPIIEWLNNLGFAKSAEQKLDDNVENKRRIDKALPVMEYGLEANKADYKKYLEDNPEVEKALRSAGVTDEQFYDLENPLNIMAKNAVFDIARTYPDLLKYINITIGNKAIALAKDNRGKDKTDWNTIFTAEGQMKAQNDFIREGYAKIDRSRGRNFSSSIEEVGQNLLFDLKNTEGYIKFLQANPKLLPREKLKRVLMYIWNKQKRGETSEKENALIEEAKQWFTDGLQGPLKGIENFDTDEDEKFLAKFLSYFPEEEQQQIVKDILMKGYKFTTKKTDETFRDTVSEMQSVEAFAQTHANNMLYEAQQSGKLNNIKEASYTATREQNSPTLDITVRLVDANNNETFLRKQAQLSGDDAISIKESLTHVIGGRSNGT